MSNVITIKSVYGKVQQVYYIQPCPDPRTGKLPSCVKTINSAGDMILSEDDVDRMSKGEVHFVPADKIFEIIDGITFDLDDIIDKAHWESIKFCNWIAKDRYERDSNGDLIIDGGAKRYGVADLYVERPGEVTQARLTKKQLVHRASDYVYQDSESNRIKKCRVLGKNLKNAMPADILDYLIDKAEKEPKKIIDLYEGEDWKMQLFIIDAVDKGVIRKVDGIYKYDDKLLGASESSVINFLRDVKFKALIDSIKKETYPNLLPNNELESLQASITNGIPYFETSKPTEKPTVTTGKK